MTFSNKRASNNDHLLVFLRVRRVSVAFLISGEQRSLYLHWRVCAAGPRPLQVPTKRLTKIIHFFIKTGV